MQKQEYRKMFDQEESNWYFKGKRSILFRFLSRFPKKPGLKILDVGCGTGINMQHLSTLGTVFGIDQSKNAIGFCMQRNLSRLSLASIEKLPFKSNAFDLITCLDVLYHKGVKDDLAALIELKRVAKPGALLLITESALHQLWSEHDQAVQAKKRYSKPELQNLLSKAGFTVLKSTYWNFFAFPAVFLIKKMHPPKQDPSEAKSNVTALPKPINFILSKIIALEALMLCAINFPVGVDLFIAARKK